MLVKEKNNNYVVVLEVGDKIIESLTNFAIEHKLKGAVFSGIGAAKDVELGAYDLGNKDYIRKVFTETDYELISLDGNLSLKDGTPFVHIHASFGGHDFKVFGGHLFEATVAVTAEIYVTPIDVTPVREHNEKLGLGLICKFI
ncbi:MAG: DNA-binding protein [Bdellovibrionaceae bacterium]|mgnify:CR=1 FL=1|jgi:uncharacterized protein|nr:DNA-binding protein [Pseudobdellovibrionaceae bacterium]